MMLKGMTAQYLISGRTRCSRATTVLWHAAAGGVGLIASQWLKSLGVTVIGTVGSDAKAALAKAHGCEHTIVYTRENFVERVKEITGGKGVPVVYDSVGKAHVHGLARLPAAAGHDGELRQRLRRGRPDRADHPRREGIAVPDPPDAGDTTRPSARTSSRARTICSTS